MSPDRTRIAEGLHGWLESPESTRVSVDGRLHVRGWLFSTSKGIRAVAARSGRRESVLDSAQARPDVAARFPQVAHAGTSGFEGTIPVEEGASELVVEAILADGTRRQCFRRLVVSRNQPGVIAAGAFLSTAAQRAVTAWREGRLDLSPGKIALRLRNLRRELQAPKPPALPAVQDLKQRPTELYQVALQQFLATGARLPFAVHAQPEVTVILVLVNRAELTLRCLRSLAEIQSPTIELIVVDNVSSDDTATLVDQIDGALIFRDVENVGCLKAVNQAAAVARGRTLLLLSTDAELIPGSLDAALETLDSAPDLGAVGGRLVFPDGRLQEAGGIIWRDASCLGYGRGDDALAPAFQFQRDVDYVSGAFLLTPRDIWNGLGGFDVDSAAASYEDADYCVRLWKSGRRVVYDPRAAAIHFEFADSASREKAVAMQTDRRAAFFNKHRDWLQAKHAADPTKALLARTPGRSDRRILVIDERIPHDHLGAGFPRARQLLLSLDRLGWQVTLLPLSGPKESWAEVYGDIPRRIEVVNGFITDRLETFLEERRGFYSALIVSRPHNMARLKAAMRHRRLAIPIIYDAEALFADRETEAQRLKGLTITDEDAERKRAPEIALAREASVVIAVSPGEAARFSQAGRPVYNLGHAITPSPTPTPFAGRSGFLFVGALSEPGSPNVDSLRWFAREVLPRLAEVNEGPLPLDVVGRTDLEEVLELAGPHVRLLGRVDDLRPLYETARVFVAPTRFAAGIPFKVHHAAAHGVPVVCTRLLERQLGWHSGVEVLSADDPADLARACLQLHRDASLWERIRQGALERVAEDCSPSRFDVVLARAIDHSGRA